MSEFVSIETQITDLLRTAIEAVQNEQNSGNAVIMALDYLREIQHKYMLSQCRVITTHESGELRSIPFNTNNP